METVLISGGRGLIGNLLSEKLKEKGYEVALLSRKKKTNPGFTIYTWDLNKNEIEQEAIKRCNYIIHLAGANISSKRWSKKRKQLIIDSRVKSAHLLFDKISASGNHLKAFISSSAIGYYGAITSDRIFTESDPPGHDFLAETCRLWEEAADKFKDIGIRTVKIRSGVALSTQGGALPKILAPVEIGLGSAIGNGKQYMPWIHIDDLCEIYIKALEDSKMEGAYNAVAPDDKTNKEFTLTLAHVLKEPFWFPNTPVFSLKLIFGEMADTITKGSRVSSKKVMAAGFKFKFPDLGNALVDLLEIEE
jgi:uncharacterized protein (TIGR01777 family)